MDWDVVSRLGEMTGTVAFAVTAVLAVAPQRVSLFTACVMGTITAVGGGTIRDVLAGRQTMLMNEEIYAVPVLLGTSLLVVLMSILPDNWEINSAIGFAIIFGIRAAAIH